MMPLWQRTPWGRANLGQWRYAWRNALAMALSLWLAFLLQLDAPYWAMTSAAVVNFPTVGGIISKSLGRVAGSLIGAMAAVLMAVTGFSDPWLFACEIALWLALCTYLSQLYFNNVAYACQLAGYTAAIVAFSCVNVDDPYHIFEIAQARVSEVILGILCGGFMMMVLPTQTDADALLVALDKAQSRLLEHAALLWRGEQGAVRQAHEGVIGQLLTLDLLRVQAVWSHHDLRRHNRLLNYLLHCQLHLVGRLSGLRRLLHNWPAQPDWLPAQLEQILALLGRLDADEYALARLLAPFYQGADTRSRAFAGRLADTGRLLLRCRRWQRRLVAGRVHRYQHVPGEAALSRYQDRLEALYNAGRTFLAVWLGSAFWIVTNWSAGASAVTLLAVGCVLYAATPAPARSTGVMLKAVAWLSLVCIGVKFGIMIHLTDLVSFTLLLLPVLVTLNLLRLQQPTRAALWAQLVVFLGSFLAVTNPPDYDFANYLNRSLGQVLGLMGAILAFQLLQPFSDQHRSQRIQRALRREFHDQLASRPGRSERAFESRLYHALGQLCQGRDAEARTWALRWGVVLLNCSHVVWQLRAWQGDPPLEQLRSRLLGQLAGIVSARGIDHSALRPVLVELERQYPLLAARQDPASQALCGLLWRLASALHPLLQAPQTTGNLSKEPANG
ncbi:Uncharacterized membrane protein YccC [Aeromonas sp. RU39B]|nr:Uncharacterized membrane protein YccC [Aeromonas sp. RU39B]